MLGRAYDVDYYYCPRCDVAFLVIDDDSDKGTMQVLQWKREDQELKPDEREAEAVQSKLTQRYWDLHKSNLLHAVRNFIKTRSSRWRYCPMDGCEMPSIGEFHYGDNTSIKFAWCKWCKMGFGYLKDKDYGWEYIVDFILNLDTQTYTIREIHKADIDVELVEKCLTKLGRKHD